MISDQERSFLKLLMRSKDVGEGWRNVASQLVPLVTAFGKPKLLETRSAIDGSDFQVRLSEEGRIICKHAI
jgi:hypothetical protein